MNIKDLRPRMEVDSIELEIVSVNEVKQFTNERGSGKVQNAAGKDKSGEVQLTFWNDDAGKYNEGDNIKIENGWVSEFRGNLQLGAGRNGKITKL
ncbi:MAG: OB-fold nucleic acid binding domain-containing protein [archaeon]